VSRASLALALALILALRPAPARADDVETPAAAAQPEPSTSPAPRRFDTRFRLALLGDYRGVADLSAFGGGIGLSLGRANDDRAGQLELRALTGRTVGGLTTFELGVGASGERQIADGFFLGVGAGAAVFGVQRATDGSLLLSLGPEAYARAGYRFGAHDAPFVALDFGAQLHFGGASDVATWVWGPTGAVGYTF